MPEALLGESADGAEAAVVPDMPLGADAPDAAEKPEAADMPVAAVAADGPVMPPGAEWPEAAEAADAADGADPVEEADIGDGAVIPDPADGLETSDGAEKPEVAETTDGAETADILDAAEDPEGAEPGVGARPAGGTGGAEAGAGFGGVLCAMGSGTGAGAFTVAVLADHPPSADCCRLVGTFGPDSPAVTEASSTVRIRRSMPSTCWMACRRFSAWSPLPKLVAEPWFLKPRVSAVPSRLSGDALALTFIHVTLRMPLRVLRISGQARRIISIWPEACGAAWS